MNSDSPASDSEVSSTLADAAGSQPVDREQAVELIIALCELAGEAHGNDLAYGGLCPRKILVDQNLRLSIGFEPTASPLQVLDDSNRDYVAPEILAGKKVTVSSDIYSIGRILYRLLTGKTPEGASPPAPSKSCNTPLVLDALLTKTMSQEPEGRIKSVEELINNLRQTSQLLPTISRPEAPVSRIPYPVVPKPVPPASMRSFEFPVGLVVKLAFAAIVIGMVAKLAIYIGGKIDGDSSAPPLVEDDRPSRGDRDRDRDRDRDNADRREREKKTSTASERKPKQAKKERLPDAMARLRLALRSGRRDEFPQGTVSRNGSHFLVWDYVMTWPEARLFAESHGAQLAVLPSKADRQWVRDQFSPRRPLWLGAGKGASAHWKWVDGKSLPGQESSPVGASADRYLAVNRSGILVPTPAEYEYAFILQWPDDGSESGSIEAELKRAAGATGGAATSEGPALPVGTRSFGDSHFYVVEQAMTWEEARAFAASYGANLAVPSSDEEHQWICKSFAGFLGESKGLWLGGYRPTPSLPWQWVTDEPWNNVGLPKDVKPHPLMDRLLLQGYRSADSVRWMMVRADSKSATGVLLEWGIAVKQKPNSVAGFAMQPWLARVDRETKQLVASDLSAFGAEKRKLVEQYDSRFGAIIQSQRAKLKRGALRAGVAQKLEMWKRLGEALKETTKKGKLLESLPEGVDATATALQTESKESLKLLEAKYDAKLKDHLTTYRNYVEKKSSALAAEGNLDAAQQLVKVLVPLKADLTGFLAMLFPTNPDRAKLPWQPSMAPL